MDEENRTPSETRDIPADDRGRPLLDKETGEPIHWATGKQRIAALFAAIVVILITLAYTYSIYTGQLFFR